MIGNCVLCWNGWSIQWNSASVTLIQNSLSNLWNTLKQPGWQLQQVFCLAWITNRLKTVLCGFGPWYAKERFPFWRFSEEFFFLNRMSGETAPYQSILCHNISKLYLYHLWNWPEIQKKMCVYTFLAECVKSNKRTRRDSEKTVFSNFMRYKKYLCILSCTKRQ